MDFEALVCKARDAKTLPPIAEGHVTMCFDPGHTTGFALFVGLDLVWAKELDTSDMELAVCAIGDEFSDCISMYGKCPDTIVIEDYRVYKWRAQHHVGSEMLTTRVIGCIETWAVQKFVPEIVKQPANVAKSFCTDAKLKSWGLYKTGEKHARDAIRHGAYYLIFGPIRKADKTQVTVG